MFKKLHQNLSVTQIQQVREKIFVNKEVGFKKGAEFQKTYFFFLFSDIFSMLKVSQTRSNLTFLSRGESVWNELRWLISMSHGFSFWSIIISMPKIWKQHEFSRSSGWQVLNACANAGYTAMQVFTAISSILSIILSAEKPSSCSSRYSKIEERVLLLAESSSSPFDLTKFPEFLLIA